MALDLDAPSERRLWPPPLLPARLRAPRRPRLWQEVLLMGLGYWVYSLIRNGVPAREGAALTRAVQVLNFERHLHIAVEHSANLALASVHWLSLTADYWYATMHFIVTLAVLGWLWRWHPLRYRAARTVLVATNLVALIGFWTFPLAPPRMLIARGFIDTVVRDHIWGSWGSSGIDAASNQFAAMPSMHIGWSLWCAIVIVSVARRRWVKTLAVLYPIVTFAVIVGTANHFVLDAVGGAGALFCGFAVQRLLSGSWGLKATPMPVRVPLPRLAPRRSADAERLPPHRREVS
jgi:hypothetical protein